MQESSDIERAETDARAAWDREPEERRAAAMTPVQVRARDLEPYVGLRYVASLFRIMAIVVALLLIAEIVTALRTAGADALSLLLSEGSKLVVIAGLLWGGGDLVMLLIDIGHDVRATRVLLARQFAHQELVHDGPVRPPTADELAPRRSPPVIRPPPHDE